jgi:hypothetical protein
MSKWIDLVKEKFRLGRTINPKYSLKQAIQAAKKVYKKGKTLKKALPKAIVGATKRMRKSRRQG